MRLAADGIVDKEAVFTGRLGHRLSIRMIQHGLICYCRQAGVSVSCHQLRHTFGRHMVEGGMRVTSIQRLLGHSRIRTTQIYLHISDRQVQDDYEAAMAEIDRRLFPEGGIR